MTTRDAVEARVLALKGLVEKEKQQCDSLQAEIEKTKADKKNALKLLRECNGGILPLPKPTTNSIPELRRMLAEEMAIRDAKEFEYHSLRDVIEAELCL